jgi:hypothetical protein
MNSLRYPARTLQLRPWAWLTGRTRPRASAALTDASCMSDEPAKVHVSMIGENWEVESETATLAQAETKEEALEAAQEAARGEQAETIVVHTSDGMIEKEIPVKPE